MRIRQFIKYRILRKDPVYSNVKHGREADYQAYFLRILSVINVDNLTEISHGRVFDPDLAEKDYEAIHKIADEAEAKDGLLAGILVMMVEQYIWADVYLRERDKNRWIYRVMNRKATDYFPDATAVFALLWENDQGPR